MGGGVGGGVRVDVNEELKKNFGGGGQGVSGRGRVGGGQGGCERRIKVFLKIQKKNFFLGGVSGRGGGGVGSGGG